jgi:hypothetical protein
LFKKIKAIGGEVPNGYIQEFDYRGTYGIGPFSSEPIFEGFPPKTVQSERDCHQQSVIYC